MSIIVQRQPADKSGDPIVSSVLTTVEAQLERGTHAINETSTDKVIITGTVPDTTSILPSSMVKINRKGIEKIGLVTGINGSIRFSPSQVTIRSQITVETIR